MATVFQSNSNDNGMSDEEQGVNMEPLDQRRAAERSAANQRAERATVSAFGQTTGEAPGNKWGRAMRVQSEGRQAKFGLADIASHMKAQKIAAANAAKESGDINGDNKRPNMYKRQMSTISGHGNT